MSLIEKLEEGTKTEGGDGTAVWKATYAITVRNGKKCLRLDTFGSATRKNPDQPSQTMVLSPEVVCHLKQILKDNFGKDE